MCLWLCTSVVYNTAQNSSDNLPSYKHHSLDVVYQRKGVDRSLNTHYYPWTLNHTKAQNTLLKLKHVDTQLNLCTTTSASANSEHLQLQNAHRNLTGLLTVQAQLLTTFRPSNIGISDWGGKCSMRSIWWDTCAEWRIKSPAHNKVQLIISEHYDTTLQASYYFPKSKRTSNEQHNETEIWSTVLTMRYEDEM